MKEEREKVFGEIISIFNDTDRCFGGLIDCGELGILEVYWRGCWQEKWHTLESLEELRKVNLKTA